MMRPSNLDPKNAGAYVNRALALARHGDFEAAMKDYAKAIALNPRQWQAYFNRAAELKDSGKLCEAVDDLKQVMQLESGVRWRLHEPRQHLRSPKRAR